MTTYNQDTIKASHKYTFRNKNEILQSKICGCFYCITTFEPKEILEWTDDDETALCPNCDIDSVIGNKSNYAVNDINFLKQMHNYWF